MTLGVGVLALEWLERLVKKLLSFNASLGRERVEVVLARRNSAQAGFTGAHQIDAASGRS